MDRLLGGSFALLSLITYAGSARATEFDNSHADLGYIDTLAGLPLAPGFYLRDDVNIQVSGRLNNGNGDPVKLNLSALRLGQYGVKFRNTIEADILSAFYVPDWKIPVVNAKVGAGIYEFVANARVGVTSAVGLPQVAGTSKAGFSDVTVVPIFIGYDVPGTDFHFVLSPLEFTAPTGRYDKHDPVGNNTGLNYWSYRPALEMTYLNVKGQEFSLNIGASINSQNQATHYQSGEEFYFTWATQQHFSTTWAVGVGGYYYKQVGDDKINGKVVDTNLSRATLDLLGAGPGNKGETFAIGPILSYTPIRSLFLQLHWDHELYSFNRPQRDVVFARATIHF